MNTYKKLLDIKLREEIDSLYVSQSTKDSLEKAIFGSLSFYTYLPLDILKRAKNDELYIDKTIDLSIYAILYVAAIVCTDRLIDKQLDEKISHKLMIEYVYFIKEHAIRGIQRILGDETHFWKSFDNLKQRLFEYSKAKNHDFHGDKEELLGHLLNKSRLIEAYVTSMQIIVREELEWDKILSALNKFHTAFQLVDDYEDLNEDIITDQLNFYLYTGKELFDSSIDLDHFIKLLYAEGIIEQGLNLAFTISREAADEFSALEMAYSLKFALILHYQIGRMIVEVKFLKEKAATKAELSNHKLFHNNIRSSINKSLTFIKNRKKENNTWSDFMTLAGAGTNWITAFVVSMLGEFPENKSFLQDSLSWLEEHGREYHGCNILDADSVNFLIKAKEMMNEEILGSDIDQWKQFRHPSGGFSTYIGNEITQILHVDANTDTKGWTSEQYCVTAVACWIAKSTDNKDIYQRSLSYLQQGMKPDGCIPSYWWTEDLYATAFAVMCGLNEKPLEYLLSRQTAEGYWTNMGKPSVFYTSLCIKALESITDADVTIKKRIKKGVKWLLSQQNDDGSWDSEYLLKIPSPEVLDPQKIKKWKKSSFGVNVITDNYERVFTTALTYNALSLYKKYVA